MVNNNHFILLNPKNIKPISSIISTDKINNIVKYIKIEKQNTNNNLKIKETKSTKANINKNESNDIHYNDYLKNYVKNELSIYPKIKGTK